MLKNAVKKPFHKQNPLGWVKIKQQNVMGVVDGVAFFLGVKYVSMAMQ